MFWITNSDSKKPKTLPHHRQIKKVGSCFMIRRTRQNQNNGILIDTKNKTNKHFIPFPLLHNYILVFLVCKNDFKWLLLGLLYIIMVNNDQLSTLIKKARETTPKKKFTQSAEITLVLKDIDVKKGFSLNEIVVLPNPTKEGASLCVLGGGDMGLRAKRAGVETVLEPDTLDRLGSNKRDARKIVRAHDFFLADASLMSSVGRALGQFLGPKGKMPTPLPYGAPIETIATRLRSSTRIRSKNQLNMSTKIGDEDLTDEQIAENANAVISAVEKRLPQGDKNLRNTIIKFTMGKAIKMNSLNKQAKSESA